VCRGWASSVRAPWPASPGRWRAGWEPSVSGLELAGEKRHSHLSGARPGRLHTARCLEQPVVASLALGQIPGGFQLRPPPAAPSSPLCGARLAPLRTCLRGWSDLRRVRFAFTSGPCRAPRFASAGPAFEPGTRSWLFFLCAAARCEYHRQRRFHAQTRACPLGARLSGGRPLIAAERSR